MDITHIKNWYNRSEKYKDPVDKFIAVWISLNGYGTLFSGKSHDKEMVEWIKRSELKSVFEKLLSSDEDFKRDLEELKKECPVFDMRPGFRNKSKTITDIKNFNEVIDVIYQIRCNLFHGSKDWTNPRDRKLATLAFRILKKIFNPM
jgi:hypothetical protein